MKINNKKKDRKNDPITGLTETEITELCALIVGMILPNEQKYPWPQILGLRKSVKVTLQYLRRNHRQVEIAKFFGVSQPTISRAISAITPLIVKALAHVVPTAYDLDTKEKYLVDGTLAPCWSWRDRRDLYSGKHKTTGMNLQIVATEKGDIKWVSDPLPGSIHDVKALDESGALETMNPANWIADKGYQGREMVTPIKKRRGQERLTDEDKAKNKSINSIRSTIERVIAHLKNWQILHTDYRKPINTFPTTITAVISLHFWKTA